MHALKSGTSVAAAQAMGGMIVNATPADLLEGVLVPVPVRPGRRLSGGFNPAAELAAAVATVSGLPRIDLLRRRWSGRQTGLKRTHRIENARGTVIPVGKPAPEIVVLVDDVYTTGATLDVCAGMLRAAGSRRVRALTFARTPGPRLSDRAAAPMKVQPAGNRPSRR